MAYGGIIGYEPTSTPGAYMFKQSNGASSLFSGPAAESLKARLDASSGLAGQQTAGPGGGAPADSIPEESPMKGSGPRQVPAPPPPNMSVAPPPVVPSDGIMAGSGSMSVTPAPQPAAADYAKLVGHSPAAAHQAQLSNEPPNVAMFAQPSTQEERINDYLMGSPLAAESAQPTHAPVAAAHPVMVGGVNTGLVQGPDGRLYQQTPGVAAQTRQSLTDKAGQGVAMPHSMSETIAGGFAPDKDYLERRHELAIDKGLLIDQMADKEEENAAREKAIAAQQLKDAANLRAEEQARANEIQARVAKDEATKDRLTKEYGNAKVDPRRLFSGPGGGARSVLAALSAGLGALGSGLQAMGGHAAPNYAAQAIDAAINRDIAAQETEIKVKGDMANNALAQFQRSGLSLDQARTALRSAQLNWTSAQNQQSAAITKGSMVGPNAQALHQAVSSLLNDNDEQYRQNSLGSATKSVASQVAYPHAGSAGGLRAVSPEKAISLAGQTTDQIGKNIENQQKLYNLSHPKGGAGLADNLAAQQEVVKAGAEMGLGYDHQKGSFEGEGTGIWTEGALSGHKSYINSLEGAAPLVEKALGNNRISQSEIDDWTSKGKRWSGEQNKLFLQSKIEALKAKERAIRAGGGGGGASAPTEGESEGGEPKE